MEVDLYKETNEDLKIEPEYLTDKKFKVKLKFNIEKN